eukprot:Skav216328  [mRNA]  locus=scaffold3350:140207:142526:+ [translate_table: standard]
MQQFRDFFRSERTIAAIWLGSYPVMSNRAQIAPLIVRGPQIVQHVPGVAAVAAPGQIMIGQRPVPTVSYRVMPHAVPHAPDLQLGRGTSLARQGWDAVQRTAMQVINPMVETFECRICLTNLPVAERVVFRDCHDPKHGCCKDCTRYWIKERVESGHVFNITCSRRGMCDCNARVSDEEVLRFTDTDTHAKYMRFKSMREDDTVRECPQCGHMCKPNYRQGEIVAEMKCPSCSCNFCYYHSNAHAGRPCDEYSRQISKQLKEMEQGALADSKPCPKCGLYTAKTGGCNHMTCAEHSCRTHWCWVCGQEIEGGADGVMAHYSGRCNHFPEIDETTTPGMVLSCLRILTFPIRVFFMVMAALILIGCLALSPITLFMVSFSACLCCHKLRLRSQVVIKAFVLIPGFLLYIGIALLWMLLVFFFMGLLCFTLMPAEQCLSGWCGCPPLLTPNVDRTHLIWLLTLPFNSLNPVRSFLQCYFTRQLGED